MSTITEKKYKLPVLAERAELVKVQVRRGLGLVGPLLRVIEGKGWIAGGFARWCCSPNENPAPAADLDVFFGDEEGYLAVIEALGFMGAHATRTVPYLTQMNVERAFPGVGLPEIQLIRPIVNSERHWGPSKDDVVRQIDITVCRIALDGVGCATATADQRFLADESERKVCFVRINDPVSVIRHAFKYAAKGYRIQDRESMKLLNSWSLLEREREPVGEPPCESHDSRHGASDESRTSSGY